MQLCRRVLTMFADGAPLQQRQIDDAAAAANLETIARVAHAIKGTAGNISAFPLWEAAAELDHLARSSQRDAIAEAHRRLNIEFRRVLEGVPLRMNELAVHPAGAAETLAGLDNEAT